MDGSDDGSSDTVGSLVVGVDDGEAVMIVDGSNEGTNEGSNDGAADDGSDDGVIVEGSKVG